MNRLESLGIACVVLGSVAIACSGSSPGKEVIIVHDTAQGGEGGSGGDSISFKGSGSTTSTQSVGANGGSASSAPSGAGAAPSSASASGLPCDVAAYLSAKCGACHGDPPIPSALAGLVTFADLQAKAKEDPTKTEAELSLARMQDAKQPMPPGALPPAADLAIIKNWADAGYPKGTCGATSGAGGAGATMSGGSSGAGGSASVPSASGLPCDLATYLATKCGTCHGDPPIPSALAGLMTFADLQAKAKEDPTKNEAQLSLARMQSTTMPMPPGAPPSAADVALLKNWIDAGYPKGTCASGAGGASNAGGAGNAGASNTGGKTGSGGSTGAGSGVPCDVATYLAANCTSCHGDPPVASALSGLVTYADLKATAKEDATKNEAQLSVARMQNASSPMPPGKLPSAADVAIIQNWINAGYPMGSCTSPDGGVAPPPPPPSVVFKNTPPYAAHTGPSTHNAGRDCMSCHKNGGGEAPRFSMGGTVYDGSGRAVSGVEVRLVDASGKGTSVYTGSSGTFYLQGTGFAAPAYVGVRNAAATEEMHTALAATNGGCSSCHCSGTTCSVPVIHLP